MFEILSCFGTALKSRLTEEITRGPSHTRVRWLRDYSGLNAFGEPVEIKAGNCTEAWDDGVRKIDSWDVGYDKGTRIDFHSLRTPLTEAQFQTIAKFYCRQIGKPYDKDGCERLIPGAQHFFDAPDSGLNYGNYDMWFCSEYADAGFELADLPPFNQWKAFDVSPVMLPNSLLFNREFRTRIVGSDSQLP